MNKGFEPQLFSTPVYWWNYESEPSDKIIINRGGTRSSKTHSLCQLFVTWLVTGYIRAKQYIPSGVASIVRKNKTTVAATIMRDFENILKESDIYRYVEHNKTNRTYRIGERVVEFFGADNEQKLRGYGSDILYCNEANELTYKKEFFQLLIRTRGPVFIDFNPSDPYIWIKSELEDKRRLEKKDVVVFVSTYKDNPFLPNHQIKEIEYLEKTDSVLWKVYGLGQYGVVEGLVIPNVTIIEEFPLELRKPGGGIDFGFTNSYTAVYRCGLIEPNNLYVDQLVYETGLNDSDLVRRMNALKVSKKREFFADSAQPGSIKELRSSRYNVRAANKYKNSVIFGVGLLRRHNLFVTARSEGIIKEQMKYKYKQHTDGTWLNEPIDEFNHAFDAIRYYALSKLAKVPKTRGRRTKAVNL